MAKCGDVSCESACLSDAASNASYLEAAAIFGVSSCGGADGCFDSRTLVQKNVTGFVVI